MLIGFPTQKDVAWIRHVGSSPFECRYALGVPSQPFGFMATVVPAINTLIAVPFMTGRGGAQDRLAFEVTTLAAGALARVGIYDTADADRSLYPNKLLVDGGEFSAATTGVKDATIGLELPESALCWAVYICGVAAPTLRGVTGSGSQNLLGFPSTIGATVYTELSVAQAYGALPATFPSGALPVAATIPLITLRKS